MPRARFEPAIPATKRPQTYALDRTVTMIGSIYVYKHNLYINKYKLIFWVRGNYLYWYRGAWSKISEATGLDDRGSVGQDISLGRNVQTGSGANLASCPACAVGLSSGAKWLGLEVTTYPYLVPKPRVRGTYRSSSIHLQAVALN
jgi:hypothetical protein